MTVTLELESHERRAGRRCELAETGPISPEAARRLACDATVSRVIVGPRSEPLDVGAADAGRARRAPPGGGRPRRRLSVPGCDRPPGWSDAHHVVHWADGGETALGNLVLLCRPHHRLVHETLGLEMLDGHPVFRRPDGSVLEDRGPPQTMR